jgi:hypothetical protein
MPPFVFSALLLVALATGVSHAAENRVRKMDVSTMLKEKIAGLGDNVYALRDDSAVAALPAEAALSDFQGLLLGAPRRVDLARNPEFAALLLAGRTPSRSARVPWHLNAVLVAVDIDRGAVFAGPAFPIDASKSPEPPEPAPAPAPAPSVVMPAVPGIPPPPEGSDAGTAWLDVQRLLRLPRQNSRLALRALYFDQFSNAAVVERVVDSTPLAQLPAADARALVARLRAAGQSTHKLPAYRRHESTPTLSAAGAAFTIGRSGSSVPLHAALRIELFAPMIVRQDAASRADKDLPLPAAVVRATVLVVRKDHNNPYLFPIEIPVWAEHELVPGKLIDAAFSVDLATLLPAAVLKSAAQVYVLAGRHLGGPVALTP